MIEYLFQLTAIFPGLTESVFKVGIGMPASGKRTIGVLLAKRLGYTYVDVDIVLQEQEMRL